MSWMHNLGSEIQKREVTAGQRVKEDFREGVET